MSIIAEQLVRATLAQLGAQRQESIAIIEVYLANPTGVADHPNLVTDISSAVKALAEAEDAIGALHRNFISTEGAANDE